MPAARTDDAHARRRVRAQRIAGLYAVTPDLADTADLASRVAAALAGGAAVIQYRNKAADTALRRAQAIALARVQAIRGGLYIVNDDAVLAVEVGADGVHVGEDDAAIAAARVIVGPDRIVGASCYNDLGLAHAAVAAGADYVAFGSFFPSAVKPDARRAEVDMLGPARTLGVPVVAIGGITAANAPVLIRAGADAVAVITAVFDAPDVEAAARAIANAFPSIPFSNNPMHAP
ncbi:MAG: thiamine phosphate synthase [Casimicrobiaceae bacterium]